MAMSTPYVLNIMLIPCGIYSINCEGSSVNSQAKFFNERLQGSSRKYGATQ